MNAISKHTNPFLVIPYFFTNKILFTPSISTCDTLYLKSKCILLDIIDTVICL